MADKNHADIKRDIKQSKEQKSVWLELDNSDGRYRIVALDGFGNKFVLIDFGGVPERPVIHADGNNNASLA